MFESPNVNGCGSRDQGEIAEKFDEAVLDALLGAIPEDQPSAELCPWFRTVVVPFVRRVLPRGQVRGGALGVSWSLCSLVQH